METFKSFETLLYRVNDGSFGEIALKLFRFQASENHVYRDYLRYLGVDPGSVAGWRQIPFMPIAFFKSHQVKTGEWEEEAVFSSSGTGGQQSRHYVSSYRFYLDHAARCFRHFYGAPEDWAFVALLPSYLEREGSSLVAMINDFISQSKYRQSGFFLHNHDELVATIRDLQSRGAKVMLWGVTYALLDLAEKYQLDLRDCMVIETGGMKGRRREITRDELHHILMQRFRVPAIHSEFGMTELLTQAYSTGNGLFRTPPWMRVAARDPEDPFNWREGKGRGGLNVIDLANIHSCAFVETQDLVRIHENGNFEILGRLDNSDIRGCNLLVE